MQTFLDGPLSYIRYKLWVMLMTWILLQERLGETFYVAVQCTNLIAQGSMSGILNCIARTQVFCHEFWYHTFNRKLQDVKQLWNNCETMTSCFAGLCSFNTYTMGVMKFLCNCQPQWSFQNHSSLAEWGVVTQDYLGTRLSLTNAVATHPLHLPPALMQWFYI